MSRKIYRPIFLATIFAIGLFRVAAAEESKSAPSYVGSDVCAECHAEEVQAWRGSHHAGAMLKATSQTVLAPFAGEGLEADGGRTTFLQRDGEFVIRTRGTDGKHTDFEVAYTFGITPLQQYLISMPGGRYQAFNLAWDSRPKSKGGQRWFDLYPDDELKPGDPLHWTGIDQNWNYQCAWCHSTNLRKNYDSMTDTYSTTFSEINVGCEACHGPGRTHVGWARGVASPDGPMNGSKGLAMSFDERDGVAWDMLDTGTAKRSEPRSMHKETDVCAGCHARRGQFASDHPQLRKFLDSFRPSLIEPGLYHSDGQQLEEVYKWGSFLQSRMHAEGVTCSDCHDPHSGKTVLEGNALCGQCHQPKKFDTVAHHHHPVDSAGAKCVACHMPATDYMIVDARRDHSLRIPRPELTVDYSIPNACNRCHSDRDAAWAVAALDEWHPGRGGRIQDFAGIFAKFDRGQPGAREALILYLAAVKPLPIVTASALDRLARQSSPAVLSKATDFLNSPEPLERSTAIAIAALAEPRRRLTLLIPYLKDNSRLVRMDAARALAGQPESLMDAVTRRTFEAALAEYTAGQMFNAERPEANVNLASLYLERRDLAQAKRYFEVALRRDRTFVPATIGLARVLREQNAENAAEALLREAAHAQPLSPDLAHALGLTMVRRGARDEALEWLQKAARLGQTNPRFGYVYAVALHDMGHKAEAMATLKTALLRHRYDRDLLRALLSYQIEAADSSGALDTAETLAALDPHDVAIRNLAAQLRRRR